MAVIANDAGRLEVVIAGDVAKQDRLAPRVGYHGDVAGPHPVAEREELAGVLARELPGPGRRDHALDGLGVEAAQVLQAGDARPPHGDHAPSQVLLDMLSPDTRSIQPRCPR